MERRTFVAAIAAAMAAGADPLRACAPSPQARAPGLGIQLYTLRSEMERDFEGTLARVAEIGYREVEFAGYFDRSAADVRATLDSAGLTAPAAHVGLDLIGDAMDKTVSDAATIGHRYLVVPWISEENRTLDGFRQVAEQLNRASEQARANGLTVGYHNHDFEFVRTDDQIPLDVLLAETDPSVVLELDIFWAVKGGADPLSYFSQHSGRVKLIHAKDMDAAGNMTDVGAGTIDFAAILNAGEGAGLEHVFVEHDQPADPFATARAGHAHLQQLISEG